jgi:hypothetical protein
MTGSPVARHLKRYLGSSAVVTVFHLHIKFRYCTISLSRRSRPAWSGSSATARQDLIEIKAKSITALIESFMLMCVYILNERNLEMGKLPVFIAYTPDSIAARVGLSIHDPRRIKRRDLDPVYGVCRSIDLNHQ